MALYLEKCFCREQWVVNKNREAILGSYFQKFVYTEAKRLKSWSGLYGIIIILRN